MSRRILAFGPYCRLVHVFGVAEAGKITRHIQDGDADIKAVEAIIFMVVDALWFDETQRETKANLHRALAQMGAIPKLVRR